MRRRSPCHIRDSNVAATIERPWKVLIQRRHQPCCPFREYRQDTVSALAGAHQVVLGDHEEYLVIQTLQFLSPHFRVAFLQPTESCHLRGQSVFSGLFIQRLKGLKSAFVFLEGNGTIGRASLLLDWERRRFFEQLRAVRGSLDTALPLRLEESPAPPVSRVAPWTPAAAASLFCGWDFARGRLPLPVGDLER